MEAFSDLLSIIVFGAVLVFAVTFLAGNLAYFIRRHFSFRDPRLQMTAFANDMAHLFAVVFAIPVVAMVGVMVGLAILDAVLTILLFPWRSR